MTAAPAPSNPLSQLAGVSADHGTADLAERLSALDAWMRDDIATVHRAVQALRGQAATHERAVANAAAGLLGTGGKYLRPVCVALAAKVGSGFGAQAQTLAVAVEMVHNATLLHDDVVDQADVRRGQPAARVLYNNAASIFAGDWLLVNALMRVNQTGIAGVMESLLAVIEEMVLAESLQLERRGRVEAATWSQDAYLRVARGKTAALFRWAMHAGARAGGVPHHVEHALVRFGEHLGVAFQVIDDCLDFSGTAESLGKQPLIDLCEGKITYPLLLAAQQDAGLIDKLAAYVKDQGQSAVSHALIHDIAQTVRRGGALANAQAFAREQIALAVASLEALPVGEARQQLRTVAEASILRSR